MNEEKKLIIADTSFYKDPSSFELKQIAQTTAKIAKIFGWTPRVALTSFATYGRPRGSNSKVVEDAVRLLDEDESINFE